MHFSISYMRDYGVRSSKQPPLPRRTQGTLFAAKLEHRHHTREKRNNQVAQQPLRRRTSRKRARSTSRRRKSAHGARVTTSHSVRPSRNSQHKHQQQTTHTNNGLPRAPGAAQPHHARVLADRRAHAVAAAAIVACGVTRSSQWHWQRHPQGQDGGDPKARVAHALGYCCCCCCRSTHPTDDATHDATRVVCTASVFVQFSRR